MNRLNPSRTKTITDLLDKPSSRHALASPFVSPRSEVVNRFCDALSGISWVAWKYGNGIDADDYVQTLLVAESLAACNGFDHRDIVARHRQPARYQFGSTPLGPGGVHPDYKGQVSKLLQSEDPLYKARDGVSDGAAMKVSAVAAYYLQDFRSLVTNTDRIARITHASVEARLAAVLVALRLRQVVLGVDPDNVNRLVSDLTKASELLEFGVRARFFLDRVNRARELTIHCPSPAELLHELCRRIGMEHLAWSTPISACFWSFNGDADLGKWLQHWDPKLLSLPSGRWSMPQTVGSGMLELGIHLEDACHLLAIGQFEDYAECHGYHWRRSNDIDTFFSIAMSILAARHGTQSISDEVSQAADCFGENLMALAERLVPQNLQETDDRHTVETVPPPQKTHHHAMPATQTDTVAAGGLRQGAQSPAIALRGAFSALLYLPLFALGKIARLGPVMAIRRRIGIARTNIWICSHTGSYRAQFLRFGIVAGGDRDMESPIEMWLKKKDTGPIEHEWIEVARMRHTLAGMSFSCAPIPAVCRLSPALQEQYLALARDDEISQFLQSLNSASREAQASMVESLIERMAGKGLE